jgi:signal transduction histidine kinase/ligand-binding sensor domain-containing protein
MTEVPGMPSGVLDVAQDEAGFLWIASEQGLDRFDGREVIPWDRDRLSIRVEYVEAGPRGRILAGYPWHQLWEVDGNRVRIVTGANGEALDDVFHAVYSTEGRLWVTQHGRVRRRADDGRWETIDDPGLQERHALYLMPRAEGGVVVGTEPGGMYSIDAALDVGILADDLGGRVTRLAPIDDRRFAAAVRFGPRPGIWESSDGKVRQLALLDARHTGLVHRRGTIWASSDQGVLVIDPDGRTDLLGPESGFAGGGRLEVDAEESLWVTSERGLMQFPEPDVVLWTPVTGPIGRVRAVCQSDEGLWANTWAGPSRFDPERGHWEPVETGIYTFWDVGGCDSWQRVWLCGVRRAGRSDSSEVLLQRRAGRFFPYVEAPRRWSGAGYATDVVGRMWIAFDERLWIVDGPDSSPRAVAQIPDSSEVGVAVDRDGVVTLAFLDGRVCRGALPTGDDALQWDCEQVSDFGGLYEVAAPQPGVVWLGTELSGVVTRVADEWRVIVGADELGARRVTGLTPSPRGGIWIASEVGRVRARPSANGAEILERLTTWNGIPAWPFSRVDEQPDGTLWLSGLAGAVRVPASARDRLPSPPTVHITELRVDGVRRSVGEPIRVPHASRRIEVRAAATSYRDPAALRYEVRARPDLPWSRTTEPSFRFVELAAGDYRIEVRASLDGRNWSESPAEVAFTVSRPWYRQPWFALTGLLAVATAAYAVYRLRLAHLVGLERQRTAIAMDLHDEMGAGLGSIGLLADLAQEEELAPGERRQIAARVSVISRDLARTLADIVWSLRPVSATLRGLAQFLRQRAADLFASERTELRFKIPEPCPPIPLSLDARRAVQAIVSEALHNAAKHSGADRVVVSLEPSGAGWTVRVEDDGEGFDPDAGAGTGLGQESMRKRAATIGAHLTVNASPGSGCRVELKFRPNAGRRRHGEEAAKT